MKKVIEIGQIVAGPTAGLILSDYGYDVIKIEKPGTGDIARNLSGTSSGTFPYYNRGKRSLTLDISKEEGRKVMSRIIKSADIIIENLAPGSMEKLGFGYNDVKKLNEKIIYLSIKGYMEGPYHHRKSLDYPIEIESGLAYMTGKYNEPMRMGASIVDMTAAILGVTRVFDMLANQKYGYIEIGLFETAMFLVGQHIATYQINGQDIPPINERNFAWGVYDYFLTADNKRIFIAVSTDEQWKGFCDAFSMDGSFSSKKYATNSDRYSNRDVLIPEIQKKLILMSFTEIKNNLDKFNISYGILNRPWDLLKDVHAERYMFNSSYNGVDYKFPATPPVHSSNASVPDLGRDNYTILTEFGYTKDEIDRMVSANII